MKLKWYGQAAFSLTSSDGVTVITDPYTPETAGYASILDPADVVITSSDNDSFHCRADLILGNPIVINALAVAQDSGERTEQGIRFRAIEAMEALNHRYHDPDQNALYRFEMDGLQIGHMGDVGNALSAAQIDFFSGLDVLLVVVDTVPANKDNPEFKAAASKLPYVTYQIRWEQFKGNHIGGIIGDDTGSAVKWNCKTKEGQTMPTMIQTIIIHKPNFKKEEEWYRTAYYITDTGELKDNGAGRRNICTERSIGPDDEVSSWVRFFGGVGG